MDADELTSCSDEDLLQRLGQGQHDLFGTLVRRYERELYGYLHRYLGDAALAEDVFQNTFLQVYLKSGQYDPERRVRPWLYTIATNQAIDALRRQGRHAARSLEQSAEESNHEHPGLSILETLESTAPGPLEQLSEDERRELVRLSVDRLPETYRQVVILAYFQSLKYREIADILNIPVGTVKSRLHAALGKLQESWAGSQSAPDG